MRLVQDGARVCFWFVFLVSILSFFSIFSMDDQTKTNPHEKLYQACYSGEIEKAREAILQGARVTYPDAAGRLPMRGLAPLHVAAFNGHTDIMLLLMQAGANIEESHRTLSPTPFLYVVQEGSQVEAARLLLSWGAEVNVIDADARDTSLDYAVRQTKDDMLKLLLVYGARVDLSPESSYAVELASRLHALEIAVLSKSQPIVKGLLDLEPGWIASTNAFAYAVGQGNVELVKLMLDYNPECRPSLDVIEGILKRKNLELFERQCYTAIKDMLERYIVSTYRLLFNNPEPRLWPHVLPSELCIALISMLLQRDFSHVLAAKKI
jgi:ankyrin repeat protein